MLIITAWECQTLKARRLELFKFPESSWTSVYLLGCLTKGRFVPSFSDSIRRYIVSVVSASVHWVMCEFTSITPNPFHTLFLAARISAALVGRSHALHFSHVAFTGESYYCVYIDLFTTSNYALVLTERGACGLHILNSHGFCVDSEFGPKELTCDSHVSHTWL